MDHIEHIRIIREKKDLVPKLAEGFSATIFRDIFQGDGLADQIDELIVDIYRPSDFDGPEGYNEVHDELTDAVWANILHQLHTKVRETQLPTPVKSKIPQHAKPVPADPELEALLEEEELIQESARLAKERGHDPWPLNL